MSLESVKKSKNRKNLKKIQAGNNLTTIWQEGNTMSNRVFESFAGEFVVILLNKDTRQTVEMEGRLQIVHSPAIIEGYLIDEDDEYYYIGHSPKSFNQVINKKYIVHMELTSENSSGKTNTYLNDLVPTPDEETGYN
jgi:general stress protein 26